MDDLNVFNNISIHSLDSPIYRDIYVEIFFDRELRLIFGCHHVLKLLMVPLHWKHVLDIQLLFGKLEFCSRFLRNLSQNCKYYI